LGWISALMITLASRTARSTSLLTPSFARAVLRFVRDPCGFRLGNFSLLAFENLQQVHSRRPAHLFEPFYRYDGSEWFTLALDNKLIIPKRHPVQDIAESLANFQSRNFLSHVESPPGLSQL
jgi:hypothetical protein